jgi:hypothetical protein
MPNQAIDAAFEARWNAWLARGGNRTSQGGAS